MQGQVSTHPVPIGGWKQSQDYLESLLGTAFDGAYVFDREGRYVEVLTYNTALLRRKVEELADRRIQDVFPADVANQILGAIREAILSRTAQVLEYPLEATGGMRWFEGKATPFPSSDQECSQVLWIARDITDRRQAEESLRRVHEDLEGRIRQRTAELAMANARLRREIAERRRTEEVAKERENHAVQEQRLLKQMLETYEQHQRSVAHEIHDGVAQPLTAALREVEASLGHVQDQHADLVPHELGHVMQLLRDCLHETQRLMSGLRPQTLDERGLRAAIENLVADSQARSAASIGLSFDVQFDRLPPPLETAIFRIVQESLANAQQHSRSERIEIALVQRESWLEVRIEDWGVGFDPHQTLPGRSGLEGVRERARWFGGEAAVDSDPGGGTRILVTLPLMEPTSGSVG
jgi:PAS domain S-box-containing protein